MIRLFIADDHQMIIDGLKSLLEGEENIEIVGSALSGLGVLSFLEKDTCDIILLDINMPEFDGLLTTREVKKKHPEVKILILSMHNTKDVIDDVMKSGAEGYILKNAGRAELLNAIEAVNNGSFYYSSDILRTLTNISADSKSKDDELAHLSKRELEIVKLISEELTTQEIAEKLFLSPHTVDTHRKNLLAKLNVRNTAGLVKFALQHGLDKM
jgi:two-component system, NarL family, nitrate/nitrite response regulator NarL